MHHQKSVQNELRQILFVHSYTILACATNKVEKICLIIYMLLAGQLSTHTARQKARTKSTH
jgi:hypothetical protein